jgi:hypothetical protein
MNTTKTIKPSTLFEAVCSKITEELQSLPTEDDTPQRKLSGDNKTKLIKSVKKLVRESVSGQFKSPPGYASIHLNANDYSKGMLGKHLSYRITVDRAFNGMQKLGYLVITKQGVSDGINGHYLTRYKATLKLMEEFKDVDRLTLPVVIPPDPDEHPVRIRETYYEIVDGKRRKRKRLLPTPNNTAVDKMTENLRLLNASLLKNWVDLEIIDEEFGAMQSEMLKDERKGVDATVSLSRRTLYRICNDTELTRGGRFYGAWWQNIPSRYRSYITINSKRTVEFDYGGLHPSILYAEKGLEPLEDPYTGIVDPRSESEDDKKVARKVAKKIFNAMINAKVEMKAQPEGVKLSNFGMKWKEASNRVLQKHEGIADAFYSDSGARLQRIDSDMAEEIMLHFCAMKVAVLPVHDSFLVHHGYESELKKVMTKAFKRRYGVLPRLKSEPRPVRPEALSDEEASQDIEGVIEFMNRGHEKRMEAFRKGR